MYTRDTQNIEIGTFSSETVILRRHSDNYITTARPLSHMSIVQNCLSKWRIKLNENALNVSKHHRNTINKWSKISEPRSR